MLNKAKVSPSSRFSDTGHHRTPKISFHSENLAIYLRVPLNVAFAFCCSPFFSVAEKSKDNETIRFVTKRIWLQNIFCCLLTLVNFFWIIASVRSSSLPTHENNPVLYISLLRTLMNACGKIYFMKSLWFNQNNFMEIVNLLVNQQKQGTLPKCQNSWFFVRILVPLTCMIYIFLALWEWTYLLKFDNSKIYTNTSGLDVQIWWTKMEKASAKIFFIDDINKFRNGENLTIPYELRVMLGVIASAGFLHRLKVITVMLHF